MRRLLLLGAVVSSLACASEILTNFPAWDGATSIFPWGNASAGVTPTYGETVTVPLDGNDILTSFTFDIFGAGTPSISFDGYVQSWTGTATSGSPLFTGAGATLTSPGASAYTFSPGLTLTPGLTYLLYFSVLGITQSSKNSYSWGATSADTYAGGAFFFTNADAGTTGAIADLNTASWSTGTSCCGISDLAFSATFSSPGVTPEPGTVGFFLTGIGVLIAGSRLRRQKTPGNSPR